MTTERRTFRIEVQGKLPSGNPYARTHWGKQTKLKKVWLLATGAAVAEAGLKEWRPKGKVRIAFEVHRNRKLDEANAIMTIDKLIIDRLVGAGILVDDSPKYVEWGEYTPVGCKKGYEKVIITLEEL